MDSPIAINTDQSLQWIPVRIPEDPSVIQMRILPSVLPGYASDPPPPPHTHTHASKNCLSSISTAWIRQWLNCLCSRSSLPGYASARTAFALSSALPGYASVPLPSFRTTYLSPNQHRLGTPLPPSSRTAFAQCPPSALSGCASAAPLELPLTLHHLQPGYVSRYMNFFARLLILSTPLHMWEISLYD